jgi:small ligand-binding sensory domain FIST
MTLFVNDSAWRSMDAKVMLNNSSESINAAAVGALLFAITGMGMFATVMI